MSLLANVEASDRGGTRVVRVSGEVDLSNADEVMASIGREVPSEAARVVVDLSATSYLDSSGIAMIFRLAERLRYSRQELRLVVPAMAPIRRVVELTNMSQVIPVDDEVTAAPA
jgi:anti-anti-sigma factor